MQFWKSLSKPRTVRETLITLIFTYMMSSHLRNGIHSSNEEHENVLYHSYPCAYYVQSPSTLSHANSADIRNITNETEESVYHSPIRSETTFIATKYPSGQINHEASGFTLSHYSSSLGSNGLFLHEKKVSYDAGSQETGTEINGDTNRLIIVKKKSDHYDDEDEGEDEEYFDFYSERRSWWKRCCSYTDRDPCAWIFLQVCWRAMVSLGVALLVFYIATNPPPPQVSIKVARVHEFKLGEGVDATGVATKILTCNCSLNLMVENRSKFFVLHIHPSTLDMSFGRLLFAVSQGTDMYAERGSSTFRLSIETRNKAMYGAGREMQDLLDSGKGLPVLIRVRLKSSYHILLSIIKPKFQRELQCLLVLRKGYNKKHRTQEFHSVCGYAS